MQPASGGPTMHHTRLKSDLSSHIHILGFKFCTSEAFYRCMYNVAITTVRSANERCDERTNICLG